MDRKALLFFIIVILILGNMIMISAQAAVYLRFGGDPSAAIVKILVKLFLGVILFFIFSVFRYTVHRELVWYYYSAVLLLLVTVFFVSEGARRWLTIGPFSLQPSEFAKIVVILFISRYIEKYQDRISTFKYGILFPLILVLPIVFLIFLEPDLSTSLLITVLAVLMVYTAGARLWHILSIFGAGALGGYLLYAFNLIHTYQIERLKAFLERQMQSQVLLSLSAAKSGGILGKGIGLGSLKILVPVSESDFVISIIGEEMGVLGIIAVAAAYLGLVWSMIKLAEKVVEDKFAQLFVYGYAYLIVLHVMVNFGVNAGILPVTGVTLPFISRGGSSYLSFMIGLGIVVNIIYGRGEEEGS
ncbi:MAG: FtsW/RodA/SpoVE family cell cycle protein [Thermotogaceae bacterium]|nr:FtsW/RodA/SpoVE family cell cycle protein [Thermotogaceae bacterium]